MLSIFLLLFIIYIILNRSSIIEKRRKMLLTSLITSLFFFSSADPVIGLPLYMYPMLMSITLAVVDKSKIKKSSVLLSIVLVFVMLIPIFGMVVGVINEPYLILKESNTDTLDVYNQLIVPTVDFTVIKHFVFFVLYILFVVFNYSVINDTAFLSEIIQVVEKCYKILFVAIFFEWLIVNLFSGLNDRELMDFVFSFKTLNMKANWFTWGSYSVAFCFTERSTMAIVFVYYSIVVKKNVLKKADFFWIAASFVAVYCTGSSSALAAVIMFIVIIFFITVLKNRNIGQIAIVSLICVCATAFILANFDMLSSKIMIFISNESSYNSGFYRIQSIELGFEAIKNHPLFGVGIGTVYAHSMMIQVFANIGLVGFVISMMIHFECCKFKLNIKNILLIFMIVVIYSGSSTLQKFTSPEILLVFIILNQCDLKDSESRFFPKKVLR